MVVTRWQASILPSKEQILLMYRLEGLSPTEEVIPAGAEIREHRHPFDEVRTVLEGELFVNVSGNKLLLRAGDRIFIPSNTRHSYHVEKGSDCVSLYANRVY